MRSNASPRLSVIVPCHNVEAYAANTLTSLARSHEPSIEFLLVDDGSTDGTAAVLAEHADRLSNARVLTHPRNAGVSAARNTGLDAAKGEYITFLDGDDWVEPGYYPTLLAAITRLGCDMVRTDHVQVHGRRRSVHRIAYGPRGVVGSPRNAILPIHRETSVDGPWSCTGIYHRRLADEGLLRFDEGLRTAEDRPWIWRLHLRVRTFAVVGILGLFYRRGLGGSLTQIGDERQLDFIKAFEQVISLVEKDREAARFMPKALRTYCAIINRHLSCRDRLTPTLAQELVVRSRASLAQLPAAEVQATLAGMDKVRRRRLREVFSA